jgi:hypothetical protein
MSEGTLLFALVTTIVSAIVAYLTARYQSAIAAQTKLDETLRDARLQVYAPLWKMSGLLPRWPRAKTVTYKNLKDLSEQMQTWYFNTGGIYLSKTARKAYGDVQEAITKALENHLKTNEDDEPTEKVIVTGDYTIIMDKFHILRDRLTEDLSSRRDSPGYLRDVNE